MSKPDQASISLLCSELRPGDTIYTILRHRSASGMSRAISFLTIKRDTKGKPAIHDWSWRVAAALGYRMHPRHEGIKIDGCGQDMGFHVVYALGATLWPAGTKKPHGTRNGEPDSTGGYALKQQWI